MDCLRTLIEIGWNWHEVVKKPIKFSPQTHIHHLPAPVLLSLPDLVCVHLNKAGHTVEEQQGGFIEGGHLVR